jgi:phosphoglycerol transferase MdoB-like AlkP superfamily enzyme
MYKKQVKLQRIICLALLILSAVVFVYSLGIMTDLYDSLYSTYRRGKTSISGAEVYMDMQGFNQNLLHASIGLILLAVLLFVTNTQSRRRYYIGNYCAIGLFSAASVALSIWAHGQIETFKAQWLTIDFTALAENAAKKKTLYTESTFWFDIHYVIFGLLLIGTALLIANAVWKCRLMKEEQTLIHQGKEAAA